MQKKSIALVCASIALSMSVVGCVNMGGLASNVPGASSTANVDLSGHQDKLLRSYVAAGKDVNTANKHMLDALGIKAKAVNVSTTSNAVSGSYMEDQDKANSANSLVVAEALKSHATLKTAEAKAKYAQGLIALASGVKKYVGMRNDAQSFSSSLSRVSPLQLGKLQTGVYIVKNLPTNITTLSTTLKSSIDFATQNGVSIPKDVTSINDALGS